MPTQPYPLLEGDYETQRAAIMAMFRDLFENRVAGAFVGDVFQIGGDVLELKIQAGSGLTKTGGALGIDIDVIGSGGAVMKASYTAKGMLMTASAPTTTTGFPVGSNDDTIIADSGTALGMRWGHQSATHVTNTPAGTIASTDVQAALNELDTEKQATSAKDSASGYAGLNASSRITKGVDTTDDVIIDFATKGLVLKDTQGTPHYWRLTVTTSGVLVTTDLGVSKP